MLDRDPALRSASWGFYAREVKGNTLIAEHQGNKTRTPASTLKTATTAAAIAILGPDFTFQTYLAYDGTIDSAGHLNGNIYIIGGGDPTLGAIDRRTAPQFNAVLKRWTKAIENAGITCVEGSIIGDAEFFPDDMYGPHWSWEDVSNYYGAGVSGLNFHENTYAIVFRAGNAAGQPTQILRSYPQMPGRKLLNEVVTGIPGSGDHAFLYTAPYFNTFYVRGTIPAHEKEFTIRGSISDPALYTAANLEDALAKQDIKVYQPANTTRALKLEQRYVVGRQTIIDTILSPPISEIAYWTNKESNNLYAETLLRMVGKHEFRDGTIVAGIKALKRFWYKQGVDLTSCIWHDGCGLSETNAIAPKHLADMLAVYAQHYQGTPIFDAFFRSLCVAGNPFDDGNMKSFMNGTAAAQRMFAKSGHTTNNKCYTGYVLTRSKRMISFAVMVNNYTCSSGLMTVKLERLLETLALLD